MKNNKNIKEDIGDMTGKIWKYQKELYQRLEKTDKKFSITITYLGPVPIDSKI